MMNTQRGNTPMTDTQKLKGLIVSAGKTQKDVAKETGISANTLSKKINGTCEFTVREIIKICDILNITDNAEKMKIFFGRVHSQTRP